VLLPLPDLPSRATAPPGARAKPGTSRRKA